MSHSGSRRIVSFYRSLRHPYFCNHAVWWFDLNYAQHKSNLVIHTVKSVSKEIVRIPYNSLWTSSQYTMEQLACQKVVECSRSLSRLIVWHSQTSRESHNCARSVRAYLWPTDLLCSKWFTALASRFALQELWIIRVQTWKDIRKRRPERHPTVIKWCTGSREAGNKPLEPPVRTVTAPTYWMRSTQPGVTPSP